MTLTFPELHARWPDLPGPGRAAMFDTLSSADREACWAALRQQIDGHREMDRRADEALYAESPPPRASRRPRRPVVPPRSSSLGNRSETVERLRSIPAEEYVERLVGERVGPNRKINCPLHSERTASFHVFPDARGWHCFGCGRGGDIFTLASELTETPAYGSDFKVLVGALSEVFG